MLIKKWEKLPENMQLEILYGYTGSLKKGAYELEKIEDGFKITYYFDGKEIHPVTATEWNMFTSTINAFREYAAKQGWTVEADPTNGGISYTFTDASRGREFTSAIYNEAAQALYGIAKDGVRCCSDVSIEPGTELDPELFSVFEKEIAKIP